MLQHVSSSTVCNRSCFSWLYGVQRTWDLAKYERGE